MHDVLRDELRRLLKELDAHFDYDSNVEDDPDTYRAYVRTQAAFDGADPDAAESADTYLNGH